MKKKRFEDLNSREIAKFMIKWKRLCTLKAHQRAIRNSFCDEDFKDLSDEFIHKDTFVSLYLSACEDSLRVFLELVKEL